MHCFTNRRIFLLAVVAIFSFVVSSRAENIYIAQTAQGTGDGTSVANAKAVSFFNASGNWNSPTKVTGKIGPGDTVHLCGTISTTLAVQASGVSGNVITILFEPNAKMSTTVWPDAAIQVFTQNYITIDGGTNGIIENTDNGTAGVYGHSASCGGIRAMNASYLTIQNLTIRNIYVRTSTTDQSAGASGNFCISDQASSIAITGFKVTNCTLHDAYTGIDSDYGAGCSNYEFSYNTIYNCNWGGRCGDRGPGAAMSGLLVHNNNIFNFTNWNDTVSDNYHHNGFYGWAESGGALTGFQFYANTIGPNFGGQYSTSGLFLSGHVSNTLIYNNLFLENTNDSPSDGLITIGPASGFANHRIYNNTFIGGGSGTAINVGRPNTSYDIRNNLASGVATFISINYDDGTTTIISDYNLGYNLGAGTEYSFSSSGTSNFLILTAWKLLGFEVHSLSSNPNLDGSYIPQAGSPAINAGVDLSTYFAIDKNGTSRPQGSAWDIGAYEYSSGTAVAPVITTQPTSQTVATGANVTFTVSASGTPTPTYQWKKNGANIPGATNTTFTLGNVTSADAGTYTVVATNSVGFATSNGAVLTVIANAPVITTQPASQTVATGANVTFTASASGTPTPTYQWKKNGANISGATNTTFTLGNVTSADAATYTVVATNSVGFATSNGAVLTVNNIAPVITTQPTSQTVATGANVTFTVAASGAPTPTYQWRKNGTNISGATGSILTLSNVASANSGTYTVVATNSAGSATSNGAVLTVTGSGSQSASAPTITSQPTSQSVMAGASVTFTVGASGTTPLIYQWEFNGNTINGATSSSYTIGNAQTADAGVYSVTVSNAAGSINSAFVTLIVDTNNASAYLAYPTGVAINGVSGDLYVVDASENVVQKISSGKISNLAGTSGIAGTQDGSGGAAQFNQPTGITFDVSGNLIIADSGNATIRKVTPAGVVTTLAGSSSNRGNVDGTGTAAQFNKPTGVASDSVGNLYVADAYTNTIRRITASGAVVTTLAGLNGAHGDTDGTGNAARFNQPTNVALDPSGNLYIADAFNDLIRKVTPSGVVTTFAGLSGVSGFTDGTGSNALFNQPLGIAADLSGNIYVADTGNSTIRKISPSGVVTTLAGLPGIAGLNDGPGASAQFSQPHGLCVDANGNVYVADTGNGVIRRIDASGTTTTLAVSATTTSQSGASASVSGGTSTFGSNTSQSVAAGSSGGGGGAMEPWFIGTLAVLVVARRRSLQAQG